MYALIYIMHVLDGLHLDAVNFDIFTWKEAILNLSIWHLEAHTGATPNLTLSQSFQR
jgi:hypothetical protein